MADKFFKVDANAILTLGRNSIKDHTTAVIELIKNSYDADADLVELSIASRGEHGGRITISDNGQGMSESDIQNSWLRIGFSEKVSNKTSARYSRRKTGEKGIGRLSADRLGALLEVRTKRKGHPATGLVVDWKKFEGKGRVVENVKLETPANPTPRIPSAPLGKRRTTGTQLIISELRQGWSASDIEKLHAELSLLLPPYPELTKNFVLKFTNDISPEYNGNVIHGKGVEGEIEFSAELDRNGSLSYKLKYFDANNRAKRRTSARTVQWSELAPDPPRGEEIEKYQLGVVQIRLSYFVRRADLLAGGKLSLTELREYLDRNAGVKIYRDLVRVKPYGDPSGPEADWLGLGDRKLSDPAGARRSTFKIAPNQLVGAVFASRDISPALVDSSSREGLIENDAYRQLKVVLMRCIMLIETKYHSISVANPRPETKASSAKAAVRDLTGNLSSLSIELAGLQEKVADDMSGDLAAVSEQIQLFLEQAASAKREIEEIADQNTVLRGLATVGIASAIFGHETSFAVSQADGKIRIARGFLTRPPPNIPKAIERIDDGLEYMGRISGWGKFAMSRVNKDKRSRRRVSVTALVTAILDELETPMAKSDVALKRVIAGDVEAKTFAMDVEAVLINYLTNAYHEVKRHRRQRIIQVRLEKKINQGREGFEIAVSDNGSGISPDHQDRIWEPLFSTRTDGRGRPSGTGLGLSIVKSAVEELRGEVAARKDVSLGGALFSAWLPKE